MCVNVAVERFNERGNGVKCNFISFVWKGISFGVQKKCPYYDLNITQQLRDVLFLFA